MSKKDPVISLETGMLSFARSVQVAEGLFFATSENKPGVRIPVPVLEKGVRGQSSEDQAKNPGLSNPQSVEYAIVPQGHDTVSLDFSVRFMPLSLGPHACGNADVAAAYRRLASGYRQAGGYAVLAKMLIWNIANARFAWRNRYQSDEMSVEVAFEGNRVLVFDPTKLSLTEPASINDMAAALIQGAREDIEALLEGVASGLAGTDRNAYTVHVSWSASLEPGQEIFPSQEYIREELAKGALSDVSRIYAKIPTETGGRQIQQASIHSQKIGAALRHIDIWHGSEDHEGAIAVNPYGGVQETSAVLRGPSSKKSFYTLRKNAEALIDNVESAAGSSDISDDVHFVMANLVRGGVFGSSSKKAKANG